MLNVTLILQHIIDRLNDSPFSQEDFITQLKPEAFVALNQQPQRRPLISEFYADGNFEKFHGFRLLAMAVP